ncbi:MAG: hypothetical protein HWD61_07800 [Parachlamydiaceae bacterium]|nr:MAG: hypothetical protein HWD61_07800 [Parachlamydiaceae bacterium]
MIIKSKYTFDYVEPDHPNDWPSILPKGSQDESTSSEDQGFEIHTNRIQGFVLSWLFGLKSVTIEDSKGNIWHTDIERLYQWMPATSTNLDSYIDSIMVAAKKLK